MKQLRLTESWWLIGIFLEVGFLVLCFLCGRTIVRREKCRVVAEREHDNRMLALMMLCSVGSIIFVVCEAVWSGPILDNWFVTVMAAPILMVASEVLGVVVYGLGTQSVYLAAKRYKRRQERLGRCEQCNFRD